MRDGDGVLNSTWGVSVLLCCACMAGPTVPQPSVEPMVSSPATQQERPVNGASSPAAARDAKGEPELAASDAPSQVTTGEVAPTSHETPRQQDDTHAVRAPFTLPVVSPPFGATAGLDDGQWRPFGGDSQQVRFWRTTLHPHPRSRFVSVDVVALDLRRFRLHWIVGAGDVGAELLAGEQTPGLLDPAWAVDAVAVFNGGFQARHGYWGQQSHGVTLVKPKPEGCGMALYEDGSVALGKYADCDRAGLVTYRQTPPCLIEKGAIDARLLSGRDDVWAGKSAREKTRRRSAVGLSPDRQTLYYAVGVETAPVDLARAMEAVGVEYALQLDINWNWTRFFVVDAVSGTPTLGVGLLDGMVADKGEYVRRASKRDFFAVVRRHADD